MFKNIMACTIMFCILLITTSCWCPIGSQTETIRIDATLDVGESYDILTMLEKDQNYVIRIESFGGSAFDLLAIINRMSTLRNRGYHITTETYGFIASAGWFIFNMGDVRLIHEDAIVMTHCAAITDNYGQRHTERTDPEVLGHLKILNGAAAKRLLEMGLDEETIEYLMYDEDYKWISAESALRLGIATDFLK